MSEKYEPEPDVDLDEILDQDDEELFPNQQATMTPASVTEITLNPKVGGEATDLQCPHCEETIRAWSGHGGELVEYKCGCEDLRKFRVQGESKE